MITPIQRTITQINEWTLVTDEPQIGSSWFDGVPRAWIATL